MVRIIFILFILLHSFKSFGKELSADEKKFFNFIDINRDKNISLDEINQSFKLIFQIIDLNQDGKISELEIIELKNLIESF